MTGENAVAANANPVIARHGWPLLTLLLLLAVLARMYVGWAPAVVLLALAVVAAFLFRDPRRVIPPVPLAVVSPASGELAAVDTVYDPWLKRQAVRCGVRMYLWDVHSLRSPIEGKVMDQWTARNPEPGVRRRYTYWIRTDEGDDVTLSIAAGWLGLLPRIHLYCGERAGQGHPCGFLFFAGLVEVYVPENTRLEVKPGQHVDSGAVILGRLVHNPAAASAAT